MVSDSRLRVRHLEALHEHSGRAESIPAAVLARREAHSAGLWGNCQSHGHFSTPDPQHSKANVMMFCAVQSLRVNAAAYDCSWYAQSHRYKRLLHMVIKRAQDPVKFCAGSFYDINIEKFDHVSFQMVCRRRRKLLNSSLFCKQMGFISGLLNLQCFQFSANGHPIFRNKCWWRFYKLKIKNCNKWIKCSEKNFTNEHSWCRHITQ